MPVDPHTCREHAKRCLRLAVKMTNPKLRRQYADTARMWEHLAADVKDANRQALAYVFARERRADADTANVLTMNEARRIASNIVRIREPKKKPR